MSTKLCRRVFWPVNMQSLARLHSAPRVTVSGHGAHAEAGERQTPAGICAGRHAQTLVAAVHAQALFALNLHIPAARTPAVETSAVLQSQQ